MRCIVAGTGGKQGIEHRRLRGRQLFAAAGNHGFLAAETNRFIGVANTLTPRGTGARSGMNAPTHTKKHTNIDRRRVRHHANVGISVEAVGRLVDQHVAEIGHRVWLAGGGAVSDTHVTAADQWVAEQPGIRQC